MSDLQWRRLRPEDAPAWAELLAAVEAVDATGENLSVEDLDEELADQSVDLTRDSWAVIDGERMVASGVVSGSTEVWDLHTVHAFGVVHPDYRRRGIGRRLLAAQLDRGEELHYERHPTHPGRLSIRPSDHVTSAQALPKAAGLEPVRHWFDMERDLRQDVPPRRTLGDPLRLAPFTPARDEDVRRAHNAAFRDHYGSTERDPGEWKQWFTGSRNFRAELSFLVLAGPGDDAEIAGYLLGYFYDADFAVHGYREGWIGQLGTLPAWRGRGVASALLTEALASYREAGYEQAALDVDSANASGALGLYERAGFVVTRSATSWVRDLPARPAG
ncbi:GNAT family N-acetyltransferase [soil metagenome]